MLAAKSILERLGVDPTIEQENSTGQQLLAQSGMQQPPAVAHALPFAGNLNISTLMPVVVQTRLLNAAVCSAPHTRNGRVLANPVAAELLRGRRSV